jgi:two-component system, OmpR family, sensor histidine kinase QseC
MTKSIRTFLLINLLLSVTLITSLAIIGNLFLSHKDMQIELDHQLVSSATRIEILLSNYNKQSNISTIQNNLNQNYNKKNLKSRPGGHAPIKYTLKFQVWRNNQLLLRSPEAPKTPLSTNTSGFNKIWMNSHYWRTFTIKSKLNNLVIIVANKEDYRQHLENRITQDSILIMLITYPFLGFLIWIVVGRGLRPLETITEAVKHRDPNYLEAVNNKSVPTEISPLIDELNGLLSRLKQAYIRHERFTSDAAHELKTPLAALSIQTQVALRTETPQDRNEALLKVLGGVNRCSHVVQQLLTFTRMCPETGINDPIPLSLTQQITEIAAMLAPEAIAKDIDLEVTNPDTKAIITGNTIAIGILVRNLIDNAIRYSNEGGFVKIKVDEQADTVTMSVIDNGPGIPEALRARVFERFFRVIGNKTIGSGLGLGIVQQIVKLHEASIELLSPADHSGLEVKVTFAKDPTKVKK